MYDQVNNLRYRVHIRFITLRALQYFTVIIMTNSGTEFISASYMYVLGEYELCNLRDIITNKKTVRSNCFIFSVHNTIIQKT